MNKTKKMTQGAMLLAILGALTLIDRITAYWFTELVVLVAPIIIIMYSGMYSVKDGLFLSIGMAILCFVIGNFNTVYLIYIPAGIITGLAYSYFLNKNSSKQVLLIVAALTYCVSEILVSFVVYPLIGFPVSSQLSELTAMFNQVSSASGVDYASAFEAAGISFSTMVTIIFAISVVLVGIMEGIIVHLLSVFLLKRFKIKNIEPTNLWNIKGNPVVAYICFISLFSLFFNKYINNETFKYILIGVSLISMIVLMFYGYIYFTIYGRLVLNKNIGGIIALLAIFVPVFLLVLVISGFLYAAGPLRRKLEDRVGKINE